MKKVILFSVFIAGLFLVGITFAELENDYREKFPTIVKGLDQSSIDYSLDRRVEDVKNEYHETMNCLFNDAFLTSPGYTAKIIKEKNDVLQGQEVPFELSDKLEIVSELRKQAKSECSDDKMKKKIDFLRKTKTDCGVVGKFSTVTDGYSVCSVGSYAIRELRGYEKFIQAKIVDDHSFNKEFKEQELLIRAEKILYEDEYYKKENKEDFCAYREYVRQEVEKNKEWLDKEMKEDVRFVLGDKSEASDKTNDCYIWELKKSEKATFETIFLYQKYEQNFRTHVWLRYIHNMLEQTRDLMQKIRETVETYPLKFKNAATP